MRFSRQVLMCAVLAGSCLLLSACGILPGSSMGGGGSTTTGKASSSATKTAGEATVTPNYPFASEPKPKASDPLLENGDWGYHTGYTGKYEYEVAQNAAAYNLTIDQKEESIMIKEQSKQLLTTFKNSDKVHKIINQQGGDSSDASYTVVVCDGTLEGVNSTPWVTATLRAGFGTEDGIRILETYVYRLKTRKGYDNRPFVSGAIVGYAAPDGETITEPEVVTSQFR